MPNPLAVMGMLCAMVAKQSSFGYEDETIIQRGTTFKVTKVEKRGGNIYFDLEVISQIDGG
jgi:hypothetical protein